MNSLLYFLAGCVVGLFIAVVGIAITTASKLRKL